MYRDFRLSGIPHKKSSDAINHVGGGLLHLPILRGHLRNTIYMYDCGTTAGNSQAPKPHGTRKYNDSSHRKRRGELPSMGSSLGSATRKSLGSRGVPGVITVLMPPLLPLLLLLLRVSPPPLRNPHPLCLRCRCRRHDHHHHRYH